MTYTGLLATYSLYVQGVSKKKKKEKRMLVNLWKKLFFKNQKSSTKLK